MAFRAWNRGLAATSIPPAQGAEGFNSTNAFGVWLYNGTQWFPDPTFPGASTCPGSTVLWAGKLDYWLIGKGEGSVATNGQTLCRFDGVNFQWEVLKLPAATLARFPVEATATNTLVSKGGINAGACYAWNNCWFFGDDGAVVHWDGSSVTDASPGLGLTPWLAGDFTSAVARTDPNGNPFGFAVTRSQSYTLTGVQPLPPSPDGSPPPQLFGSGGGPFAPLSLQLPGNVYSGDPFTTDLVAVDFDSAGDGWAAGNPATRESQHAPAPLLKLTPDGAPAACPGYDGGTFSGDTFQWTGLSVFPNDGSALAGGYHGGTFADPTLHQEPALVQAACGRPVSYTYFRIPDPRVNPATAQPVPADAATALSSNETPQHEGQITAVAANARNDAWAATSWGLVTEYQQGGSQVNLFERPHLYHFTDGLPPEAPAGDDSESRPSLFTLAPPVYVQPPPTVVIQSVQLTVTKKSKPVTKKVLPTVYGVRSKVTRAANGTVMLYITFKLRRPVSLGIVAVRGRKVVSRSGIKRFKGKRGELALKLDPRHYPTGIKFVVPGKRK